MEKKINFIKYLKSSNINPISLGFIEMFNDKNASVRPSKLSSTALHDPMTDLELVKSHMPIFWYNRVTSTMDKVITIIQ
jgi:hypothetical protein